MSNRRERTTRIEGRCARSAASVRGLQEEYSTRRTPEAAAGLAAEYVEAHPELAGGEPIVIEYDFDEKLLESNLLRVKRFDNYTEEWANFILANRNDNTFGTIHGYDIVIGPIANDRVGRQLWRYRNHDIDMPTLVRNLKYMKGITLQYFFGTERAISYLRKL